MGHQKNPRVTGNFGSSGKNRALQKFGSIRKINKIHDLRAKRDWGIWTLEILRKLGHREKPWLPEIRILMISQKNRALEKLLSIRTVPDYMISGKRGTSGKIGGHLKNQDLNDIQEHGTLEEFVSGTSRFS